MGGGSSQVSRRPIVHVAILAMLTTLATACNSAPSTRRVAAHSSGVSSPGVAWRACGPGLQCGAVVVPVDYSPPADGSIAIALIRMRATSPSRRIGSLLLNPGGPGVSGIDLIRRDASYF